MEFIAKAAKALMERLVEKILIQKLLNYLRELKMDELI